MAAMKLAFPPAPTFPQRGFTLVELAIVMFIVSLLIGGMLLPLAAQQDVRYNAETEKSLSEIREALMGFAASHNAADGRPYLPCPDTTDDGIEDRPAPSGPCTAEEGRVPWVTLGVGRVDAWDNRFRYRVTPAFSNSATGFILTSAGTLRVCTDNACGASVATAVPAVFLSHGKNGLGAFNSAGGANAASANANELVNSNAGELDFVSKALDPAYDDFLLWLSPNILHSRMIAAGRLP
jgi:prepilin-type N-terminal cleavage/methylation domain-containing protein